MKPRWPGPADAADPWPEPWPAPEDAPVLHRRIDGVFAGRVPVASVIAEVRRAGLDGPLRLDERRWTPPAHLPTAAELARIATDLTPAIGSESPDRILGPFADERLPPSVLRLSLALGCFLAGDESERTAFQMWANRKPVPPADDRAAVRAVARAPLAPWRLERATDEGRWQVTAGVPLGAASTPEGPVRLIEPAHWPGHPPTAGAWIVGRLARGPDSWASPCALVVPGPLDPRPWPTWLRLLVWQARASGYDGTIDELLRDRGHLLTRRVLEQAWSMRP